jgi:2-polyprenyl-3-methyl-5-hydroxy-6-metoxy-1,4-benzoquinol methylase
MKKIDISGYKWSNANLNNAHNFLLPALTKELNFLSINKNSLIFELGCGNGSVANFLTNLGYNITGVDPSIEGINFANKYYPHLKLFNGSAYDNLKEIYGQFPICISLEVIEHVYSPRIYASNLFDLVLPGGAVIISTPYHGYIKNLVLSITGKMDAHFTALWDHGHIKFWSRKTLTTLLTEAGFVDIKFVRVGRIPILAKSMIAIARKP